MFDCLGFVVAGNLADFSLWMYSSIYTHFGIMYIKGDNLYLLETLRSFNSHNSKCHVSSLTYGDW